MTALPALSAGAWAARLEAAGVGKELVEPLGRFLALLAHWSRVVDLTARRSADEVIRADVLASLAALEFLPGEGRLVDIGSGNGFPAIPLLVARRGLEGTLLEPRERRWAFLGEVVRELGLPARVVRESAERHGEGGYEVLTVRGVAEGQWRGEVERLLAPGGVVVWWGGVGVGERAAQWPGGCVVTSAVVPAAGGRVVVWRRCST
jgi:16S rRNA (guanine527-N7)-methyltransferase